MSFIKICLQISRKCCFFGQCCWLVVWGGMLPLILLKYHQIQYILEGSSSISIYTSIGKIINNLFCVVGWSSAASREVSRRWKHLWVMSWSWQAAAATVPPLIAMNAMRSVLNIFLLLTKCQRSLDLTHCCCCCGPVCRIWTSVIRFLTWSFNDQERT